MMHKSDKDRSALSSSSYFSTSPPLPEMDFGTAMVRRNIYLKVTYVYKGLYEFMPQDTHETNSGQSKISHTKSPREVADSPANNRMQNYNKLNKSEIALSS